MSFWRRSRDHENIAPFVYHRAIRKARCYRHLAIRRALRARRVRLFPTGHRHRSETPQGRLPRTDFFWPNGFSLLAALFMLMVGKTAPAAQFVSLLCGAALAPLVYGLSRELFPTRGHTAGILAGLIITVAGQPILSSVVIMADIPALFWAVLAAWLLVCAWRKPGHLWWLLGAVLPFLWQLSPVGSTSSWCPRP